MTNAFKCVLLAIAVFIQLALLGNVEILGVNIDIVLPLLLALSALSDTSCTVFIAFFCGALLDALSAGYFGVHALLYMYSAAALSYSLGVFYIKALPLSAFLCAIAAFFNEFLYGMWSSFISSGSISFALCLFTAFRAAILATGLFVVFSLLLRRYKPFEFKRGIRVER